MGELFRRNRPEHPLSWTGERLVSSVSGSIECEHLHRYLLARQLCRGKNVLDIASGEGYGAALLAQTACCVTGVEVDAEAVAHATSAYGQKNLRFVEGDATEIPLNDESFDAVISFETLEHVSDQHRFLTEVKRVLKHQGFLLLSTPDSEVYSAAGTTPNPFHVTELTAGELLAELKTVFTYVYLLRQKLIHGSVILPEPADSVPYEFTLFEQRAEDLFELQRVPARAPYLLAIASDQPLPKEQSSLYFALPPKSGIPKETAAEIARLQKIEDAARAQVDHLRSLETQVEDQGKELQRLGYEAQQKTLELDRLRHEAQLTMPEFKRLQGVESALQSRQPELQRLRDVEEAAKAELARALGVSEQERTRLEQLLGKEREVTRQSVESLQRQLESSTLLSRRQALAVRRLQVNLMLQTRANLTEESAQKKIEEITTSHDVLLEKLRLEQQARAAAEQEAKQARAVAAEHLEQEIQKASAAYFAVAAQRDAVIRKRDLLAAELTRAKEEAAHQAALTEEIARLVVPVWMRKLLPQGLRSTARAVKRTLRP